MRPRCSVLTGGFDVSGCGDFTSCPTVERAETSNSEPSAIVLHGILGIGGLYIGFDSNGEAVRSSIKFALKSASHPDRALTVDLVSALSDLDNIAVRIADVAANLAVLGYWFRDELRSSTFP